MTLNETKNASSCVYDIFAVVPFGELAYPKLQPYQPWAMMELLEFLLKPFPSEMFWILNHCNSCVWIRYIIATFCFLSTLRSTEVIPHHRSSGRFGPHCGHHSDGTRCGWVQQQGGDGWLPSMYRSSRYHLAKFSCDALLCTYLFSYDILSNMLFVLGLKLKINFP